MGADGTTAFYNSEMDAGTSLTGVTFNGDVTSGFPTGHSSGYPTRIIAGKTPTGNYVAGGSINNLVINGSLIDSVLAASVAPYGGDGSLPPPVPYNGTPRTSGPAPASFSNYNTPGGLTNNIKNYSIRSYGGGQLQAGAVYAEPSQDIHVNVLESGTVNATVNRNVISTQHDDRYDFTGIFAVNTTGVNGGQAS